MFGVTHTLIVIPPQGVRRVPECHEGLPQARNEVLYLLLMAARGRDRGKLVESRRPLSRR